MFDAGLLCVLTVYATLAARRALKGPPPLGRLRFSTLAAGCAFIHLGFHAAATAAPTAGSAILLVLTGWLTFGLWWKWLSRAPLVPRDGGQDEPGDGGDDPGGGPEPDRPTGPSGDDEIDWDAFEREFAAYLEQRERRLAPD